MALLDSAGTEPLLSDAAEEEELIAFLETAYKIPLDRDALAQASTVGGLADLIERELAPEATARSLTAHVFFEIRNSLVRAGFATRKEIRPSTEIVRILPHGWQRWFAWRWIRLSTTHKLPRLQLALLVPELLFLVVAAGSFTLVTLGTQAIDAIELLQAFLIATAISCICYLPVLSLADRLLATSLPDTCHTFGDLARLTLAHNHAKVAWQCGGSNPREIFPSLRALIANWFHIDANEITRQTPFN